MNADRLHGGTTSDVRDVPLYWIKPGDAGRGDTHEVISQLQIAPTICKLLGLEIPKTMKAAALV
jgi:phosphoglycerol transferase MdoB-like AlkP superfamily enzyme